MTRSIEPPPETGYGYLHPPVDARPEVDRSTPRRCRAYTTGLATPLRREAPLIERVIIDRYRPWATTGLTVAELPQGGWTETWRDDAPPLDLPAVAAAAVSFRASQAAMDG
jgi:hypothetical protein